MFSLEKIVCFDGGNSCNFRIDGPLVFQNC